MIFIQKHQDIYGNTERDEGTLDDNNFINDFLAANNNSISFKFEKKITEQTGNGITKDAEIMEPSKYLSNFWRTIEMSLISCEINLQLKWSTKLF